MVDGTCPSGVLRKGVITDVKETFGNIVMSEEGTEKEPEGSTPIHTVSSWDVPHGFVIFKITKTPALVTCTKGKIRVTDYYPHLCGFFDRSKKGTR